MLYQLSYVGIFDGTRNRSQYGRDHLCKREAIKPPASNIRSMQQTTCMRPVCANGLKRNARRFCSLKCQFQFRYEQYIERWILGEIEGSRSNGACPSNHVRRYLMETCGFRCSICGWGERNIFSGRVPLQVDHIDGNAGNNRPENLRLLCPNHHALTETYAGANRGSGRPIRRARYLKGIKFSPLVADDAVSSHWSPAL